MHRKNGFLVNSTVNGRTGRLEQRVNMPIVRLLRIIIACQIVLTILAAIVDLLLEPLLPHDLQSYLQAQAELPLTRKDRLLALVWTPLLVGLVIAWIGLWRLWRSAPLIYTIATILGVLLLPTLGPIVGSGWGDALNHLHTLCSGLIIGGLYLSELKNHFELRNR